MSIIIPANTLAAAGGFSVDNSCRFDYASSDNVHKTPGSAGSGTKFVFSTWIKRTKLATAMNIIYAQTATNNYERIRFLSTNKIEISGVTNGSTAYNFATDAVYRDPAAWMHLHVIRDSTQGTASNRLKVYVNGVIQALTQDTALSQNYSGLITGANVHRIAIGNGEPLGAYLAEVILLDGQVITPDGNTGEFDEDSGIWKPLDVSELTFGTTGFHLDFEASGNLGNDANGGDDFTEVNVVAINQCTDSPTNNFATLNPLFGGGVNLPLTEGNLNAEAEDAQPKNRVSTIAVSSGKWYAEFMSTAGTNYPGFGIMDVGSTLQTTVGYLGSTADSYCMFQGGLDYNGGTESDIGTTWGEDVIMGIGIDLDSGTKTIKYYKGGSEIHSRTISTPANGYVFAVTHSHDNTVSESNFGNPITALSSAATDGKGFGAFEFAPPSGYLALCTNNLN